MEPQIPHPPITIKEIVTTHSKFGVFVKIIVVIIILVGILSWVGIFSSPDENMACPTVIYGEYENPTTGETEVFGGCNKPPTGWIKVTQDWKIYRNEEYGFEFAYPESWTYQVFDGGLILKSTTIPPKNEDDPGNEIFVRLFKFNGGDLDSVLKKEYSGEIDFVETPPVSYKNPQGIDFLKVIGAPGFSSDNIQAYTTMGDVVIGIDVSPASLHEPVFNKLLSTFKFIN